MVGSEFRVFTLHIEGVNIDNIPLHEVGEYIADLAQILGKDVEPKFVGITKGSINFKAKVPIEHELDVRNRGFLLRIGDAPDDAVRAKDRMSHRLGKHRARRAILKDAKEERVIEIPIIRAAEDDPNIPKLQRRASLQGQVIRLGGRKDIVPVEIQDVDDHIYICRAEKSVAKRLAKELFGSTVRVHGEGTMRLEEGTWYVEDFLIKDFDVLEDQPFSSVITAIREIPAEWKDHSDPLGELDKIRHGE